MIVCDPKPLRSLQRLYLVEIVEGPGRHPAPLPGQPVRPQVHASPSSGPRSSASTPSGCAGGTSCSRRTDGSPRCVACYMCERRARPTASTSRPRRTREPHRSSTRSARRCSRSTCCAASSAASASTPAPRRRSSCPARTRWPSRGARRRWSVSRSCCQKGPYEKLDLGYRPYYGAPRSRIELPIPVKRPQPPG